MKELNKAMLRFNLLTASTSTIKQLIKHKTYSKDQKKLVKKLLSNKEAIVRLKTEQSMLINQLVTSMSVDFK